MNEKCNKECNKAVEWPEKTISECTNTFLAKALMDFVFESLRGTQSAPLTHSWRSSNTLYMIFRRMVSII